MSDHPAVEQLKFQLELAEGWEDKDRAADLANLLGYIRKLENQASASTNEKVLRAALEEIASEIYDPWTNGAKAGDIARKALLATQEKKA